MTTPDATSPVIVRGLGKTFGATTALADVSFEVRPGEPVALDVQADSQLDDPEIGAVSSGCWRSGH